MYGVISSNKRLEDRTSEGATSPSLRKIADIFRAMPQDAFSTLHYFSTNEETFGDEATRILDNVHDHCKGLQINMKWPNYDQLRLLQRRFPHLEIILEIPKEAMTRLVIERADLYAEINPQPVPYMLVDPSAGTSQDFAQQHVDIMKGLYERYPNLGVGIAGGLSPENVKEKFEKVAYDFGNPFSIDAQGKLRTIDKTALDINKVRKYVTEAGEGIRMANKFCFQGRD